jgi:hypothetical protein
MFCSDTQSSFVLANTHTYLLPSLPNLSRRPFGSSPMSKRVFSARYGGTGVRGYAPPRSFCFRVCLYAPTFPLLLQYAGTDSVIRICDPHSSVLSMLFQLLSGTDKELANKKLRGEINVLLCGDPGTR